MDKIMVNSGDSHVLEPPHDVWALLPAEFRDRAPWPVIEGDQEVIYLEGQAIRRDPMNFLEAMRPPGAGDLTTRMKDLDQEGIWGECVFPSNGVWVFFIQEPRLYAACARAYNEWCADVVNGHSPRLVGAAILPALDTRDAMAELERCLDLGYQAVSLPLHAPEGRLYNSTAWDPLWAAIAEAGVVLCCHAGTGGPITNKPRGPGGAVINYTDVGLWAQRSVTDLVAGGALDRYPNLRVFMVEVGAAWLPPLGDRMDEAYRQHGMFVKPKLSMLPSELIRRQIYASFQHDKSAVAAVTHMDLPNVMWGSDYPHLEGTYPRTQEVLRELFDDAEDHIRERITVGTFNELFNVPPIPRFERAPSLAGSPSSTV